MKIHWFQHVPFEGLGALEGWLLARGHALTCTRFHAGDAPPQSPDGFDWLIVMGGPMNVYQYRDHPWLPAEKRMICETIAAGKRVLGICLGAQLIADALGGKVYQNDEREIGWFSIRAGPVCPVGAGAGCPGTGGPGSGRPPRPPSDRPGTGLTCNRADRGGRSDGRAGLTQSTPSPRIE